MDDKLTEFERGLLQGYKLGLLESLKGAALPHGDPDGDHPLPQTPEAKGYTWKDVEWHKEIATKTTIGDAVNLLQDYLNNLELKDGDYADGYFAGAGRMIALLKTGFNKGEEIPSPKEIPPEIGNIVIGDAIRFINHDLAHTEGPEGEYGEGYIMGAAHVKWLLRCGWPFPSNEEWKKWGGFHPTEETLSPDFPTDTEEGVEFGPGTSDD